MKQVFSIVATAVLAMVISLPASAQLLTEKNDSVIKEVSIESDIVVCGGGLAGVCAAVSAARHGSTVTLVQDRPVLGGNASSEMRMGIVGVKESHWQEAGILEEMQCRNFFYNPLQRYTLWDDIILSTVIEEPRITLLLNTSVEDVTMSGERIASVKCWNSNAYTRYTIAGKIFIDCTGDGILRLSGAQFRRGTESRDEFGESYLSNTEANRYTMGNSILMQLRKTKEHREFRAPEWAYHFTDEDFDYEKPKSTIPGVKFNYKIIWRAKDNNFWWVEASSIDYDMVHDAPDVQLELKKIAYGVWEYMKNHPDGRAKDYELDWMGAIPGKRESTRFIGPHILTQDDIVSGGHFEDVVAYGGWTLDDHDPRAFHNKGRASVEYKINQGFGIPFDCLYSVNVPNLMFAGRDISATHMGLSAIRVMATCALLGQAAGTGASLAIEKRTTPAGVRREYISELQDRLEQDDCMLPERWRKVSPLTLSAKTAKENEPMRNGIDREWNEEDNGVYAAPGENHLCYTWKKPVRLSGARFIFDSDLKVYGKRMRKLEATTEYAQMPPEMVRNFHLEALVGKEWVEIARVQDNYKRLCRISFEPVETKGIRLVVDSTWGADKAHVFAFDAL